MYEWQIKQNEKYLQYLQSEEWNKKRAERLRIDGKRCVACGSAGNTQNYLTVHHLHYKTIFHENVYTDLVTLCRSCHGIFHAGLNRKIDPAGTKGWSETIPLSTVHLLLPDDVTVTTTNEKEQ